MKWSVSASKTFQQCPRKWYYEEVYANSKSNNPARKEAHILKHLQSVYSWRGKLVDQVISSFIVPRLNRNDQVNLDGVLDYANSLMEAQLAFATSRLYRNGGNSDKPEFCALFEVEYNGSLDNETIEEVREDVRVSLTNLIKSDFMRDVNEESLYLIAQRTLQFQFANVHVSCTPDLIVFFKDRPPVIVDWKVLTSMYREHWLQLALYGVALSRITPHKDFPLEWHGILRDPTKVGLIELQLLKNRELQYFLAQEDIITVEDYIYTSANRIQQLINGSKQKPELTLQLLPVAKSADTCAKCKFRKICWKNDSL